MLHLWIPEGQGAWHWSVGQAWQRAESLEQLLTQITPEQHQQAVAYFPSRDIQLLQLSFSKAQYKQLGPIGIDYLLEEYVVLPLDAMQIRHHFNGEELVVLGMAKQRLETLQQALQLTSVSIVACLPDFLLLPEPEAGQINLVSIDGRLLAREGQYAGHSIDDLALYLDYQPSEQNYTVFGLSAAAEATLMARVTQAQVLPLSEPFVVPKQPIRHAFNMLNAVKRVHTGPRYGLACALCALALIVAQLGYDGLNWYQQKKVADQSASQALAQYKTWFGAQGRVSEQNLKSQFESQLRLNQSADVHALQLLSRIGPTLMQNNLFAQQVNYQQRTLDLQLQANSLDALQQLTQQLNQQGLQVQLGRTEPQGSGVMGWIKIQ